MEEMRIVVAWFALSGASLAFLIYAAAVVLSSTTPPSATTAQSAKLVIDKAAAVSPGEVVDVIKALAALGDGMAKAGPALWSLIGSVLFTLIAAMAAGVIQTAPPKPPTPQRSPEGRPPAADAPAAPQAPTTK